MADAATWEQRHAPTAPHWPALDGLRGLAVAAVVAFHLGWISGGFLGVDLFFALSGALITTLLLRETAATGRIDLVAFWGRRARRLLPAVAVLIGLVLLWAARWGTAAEQAVAGDDARWALPYLANWHQIAGAHDYWAAATSSSAFTHLWSLAIEEQFYVVWPLVVWAALRRRTSPQRWRLLAGITIAGIVLSVVALLVQYDPANPTRVYLGTDTRASSLLLGALVVMLPAWRGRVAIEDRRQLFRAGSWVAFAMLVGSWFLAGDHLGLLLRGGLVIHSAIAALLVWLFIGGRAAPSLQRVLAAPPLVWLGHRSYGLYLWHWPVIVLLAPRLPFAAGLDRDIVVIAISLLLTIASYTWLEQPIRRRRAWAPGRWATVATACTVVLAVFAVAVAPSGRGDVASFAVASLTPNSGNAGPREAITAPTVATSGSAGDDTQATGASVTGRLAIGPARANAHGITSSGISLLAALGWATRELPAPLSIQASESSQSSQAMHPTLRPSVTRALWIGDSVASDEEPAIGAALDAAGLPVVDGSFAARRLVESDNVVPATLFPPIVAQADADLVIVQLSLWDSPFPIERQRAAFTWFHDLITTTGAQLVFVGAPPIRADLIDPGMARQVAVVEELIADDPAHVQYIDPAPLWGPTVEADIGDDGSPDRKPDLVHVCPQGATRFAAWLVDQLAQRYDGLTPVFPGAWVGGGWTTDRRYDTPTGACAALPTPNG